MFKKDTKKKITVIAGTAAGATLGFIHNNTKGAVIGGILGYNIANNVNNLF